MTLLTAFPLFALVMGLYGLVTMPLGNAWSRWRKRLADRYALQQSGKSQAFASAMSRLAKQNMAEDDLEHPSLVAVVRGVSAVLAFFVGEADRDGGGLESLISTILAFRIIAYCEIEIFILIA
jgi:Zn-dependent protease with chaperone function